MQTPDPSDVTRLLVATEQGDLRSSEQLLPLVYAELRRLAASQMSHERAGLTMQPTALVHEAYLRLVGDAAVNWNGRGHFFGAAAQAMRRILVEQARARNRTKRGGNHGRVPLADVAAPEDADSMDYVALDAALRRMEVEDPRMARVVLLRFFSGLSVEQTAECMGISPMTVKRDWGCAKAWLYDEMQRDAD